MKPETNVNPKRVYLGYFNHFISDYFISEYIKMQIFN